MTIRETSLFFFTKRLIKNLTLLDLNIKIFINGTLKTIRRLTPVCDKE